MSILSRLIGQIGARTGDGRVPDSSAIGPTAGASVASAWPTNPEELRQHQLLREWWYYDVELLDGVVAKGIYPPDMPMLPRMMLRNCELQGMECLDLGTMEGLIPALMCRGGAARVVATDAIAHCRDKMAAIQHYYNVNFEFREVGLMYDLHRKLPDESFDLINCSGLLYHVVSPMHVLLGCRPLLRRNGLMIISTNVVLADRCLMEFNDAGRLQVEANTFWYLSVKFLDYLLRFLRLQPIDCLFHPHELIHSDVRYVTDVPSGGLSVMCRATDDPLPDESDQWMTNAMSQSWEMNGLTDWGRVERQQLSSIAYSRGAGEDQPAFSERGIDLHSAVLRAQETPHVRSLADSCSLRLKDWS